MAIVTRYFSTTGAGAADGTTWADRAALFSAGNWSSVITGFSFAGSDSLRCFVGPGTYTCSQSLTTAVITPSAANPFMVHACDSSGNVLDPPNRTWVSAQPFTTTGLPVIATTTDIATSTLANSRWRLIAFTASGRGNGPVMSVGNLDWASVTNSANNTAASGVGTTGIVRNSQIIMSGANFNFGVDFSGGAIAMSNVRIDGSAGVTGGARIGANTSSTGINNIERLTVIGCAGGGILCAAGSATRFSTIRKSAFIGNGTYGIRGNGTASQTVYHEVTDTIVVNGTALGIDAQSAARMWVSNCRLRDNTSGNFSGMGNYPTDLGIETSAGTDADEFVDTATKDYRIKPTSLIWGKGFGPGDQPAASGGGTKSYAFGG